MPLKNPLSKKPFVIGGVIVIASIIGAASTLWLGSDNSVEEGMEAIVKNETGLDVDFTPSSQE